MWSQCCVPSNISEASLTGSGEGHRGAPCSEDSTLEESAHSTYPVCNALALKLGQYRFALDSNMLLVSVWDMETESQHWNPAWPPNLWQSSCSNVLEIGIMGMSHRAWCRQTLLFLNS